MKIRVLLLPPEDLVVPLNVLQKRLGHAALSTTAVYAGATGPEAKQIAERIDFISQDSSTAAHRVADDIMSGG